MADFKQSIAILCLLLPCVVSKLINLDPEEILPGITPKLTINCSLTHNNVPDLTVINSLTLSRYNVANHEFDVVLSLDTTTLSVQQFVERQEAEITSGSQFLALTLHNPTQNDAEIYRCNVNGANAFGKNQSIKEKSKVEVLNNLTTYVEEMMRLRKVETELVNMKSKETCSPTYNSKKENSRLNFRGNSKIVKEYIQPLSLKCSFQVSTIGTDQNFTVHFMKIFHETQGVIASISEDQVIKTMEDIRLGEVQGKLSDQEGLDSYLQISWTNPSVAQSGNYFCEALAVHDENKNDTFNVSLAVLVEKPTYEDLVRILGDLLPQVEDVKDTLRTNKQELIKSTSDIKKFIYNFTIDQSLIENKFNNDIFDIKDDLRKALANFYLEQSSFRKKIDEDVYGIKDEIKKHLDKLSSAQSSLQNEIDRELSEMRNNIERFISNVNSTQALYSKRLDKVILGLPFSPPKSCRDIYSTEDRVVVTLASGLNVMCDTKTDGGGWIIFQRRINGKVDFYRGWKEYRDGFGDYLIGEFYLGNEKISMLTSKLHYEMRVDLAYENTKYFATFSTFKLLGENYKYQLRLGHYIGTAGDSLKRQHFSFFSTFDRDNDIFNENCALKRRGAWWYKDCSDSNLNGEWANNNQSAVYWDTVAEWKSATFTEMKIREYK